MPTIDPEFHVLIPPLSPEEYAGLEASLIEDGCRDAIVLWDDIIVDGHNRFFICKKHSLPFNAVNVEFPSRSAAKVWIIRNQFARRNLDAFTRATLALKMKDEIALEAKERQRLGGIEKVLQKSGEPIRADKELARIAGVSHDTIHKVETILNTSDEGTRQAVLSGEMSINQAYNDVKGRQALLRVAKRVRLEMIEENREAQQATIKNIERISDEITDKYSCLIIDPPWDMTKIDRDVRENQAGFDYPTMTVAQIKTIPVSDIASDAAHLYLWTTQKYLPAGFDILATWGFNYIFTMVWHKPGGFQPFGLPQYNCEFVLFGRRGKMDFLDTKAFPTCFNALRQEHSRKPDEFYDLVRRVSGGPRIDVFSREKRDGFDQYGNEIRKFSNGI